MEGFVCLGCMVIYDKLEGNFHKDKNRDNGHCSDCASCRNVKNRRRLKEVFDVRLRMEAMERRRNKARHGISDEEAERLMRCADNIFNKSKKVEEMDFNQIKLFMKKYRYENR